MLPGIYIIIIIIIIINITIYYGYIYIYLNKVHSKITTPISTRVMCARAQDRDAVDHEPLDMLM